MINLEVLESRLAPASQAWSYNWSGYAIVAAPYSVQAAYGSWKVPAVSGSGTAYSSTWVGIDGFGYPSETVQQIGTASEIRNGRPVYYAWWEAYPDLPYNIPGKVAPGDVMRASVVMDPELKVVYDQPGGGGRAYYDTHSVGFTLTLKNASRGWTFSKYLGRYRDTIMYSSAEWVHEAPLLVYSDGRTEIAKLPNYGSVTFFDCRATIGSLRDPSDHNTFIPATTGGINESYLQGMSSVQAITMYNWRNNKKIAVPSSLVSTATGSAFTVGFGQTVPPAPKLVGGKVDPSNSKPATVTTAKAPAKRPAAKPALPWDGRTSWNEPYQKVDKWKR